MKNHEEFRNAVFEKAAAYEKQRKLKRQKAVRIAVSLCSCMVFAVIVAFVPIKTLISNMKTANDTPEPNITTTEEISGNTDAPIGTEVIQPQTTTKPSFTVTTAVQTMETTEAETTAACTSTTSEATTETMTVLSTTTTIATSNTPVVGGEEYFYNGALTLQFSPSYGICDEPEVLETYIVTSSDGLSKMIKEYFNKTFFKTGALVCVKIETENQYVVPSLAGMQFTEDGVMVFLDVPKNENPEYIGDADWLVVIPVSNTLISSDSSITVEIIRD